MKYETPELTTLTAINAIQSNGAKSIWKTVRDHFQPLATNETQPGYADWEYVGSWSFPYVMALSHAYRE